VEFVNVVAGTLPLVLPGEVVDLATEDAFTMPGATPHVAQPSTTVRAEVLWALRPAT
jgi:hypothetical protein